VKSYNKERWRRKTLDWWKWRITLLNEIVVLDCGLA